MTQTRPVERVAASVLIATVLAVALVVSLLQSSAVHAQQATVQIAALRCDTNPESVQLTNGGTSAVALTGWKLVSDPAGSDTYDLSLLGSLTAGASVFIESGPAAGGAFKWATTQVFRDGDASDYVRLVDNTGATVQQVACAAVDVPHGGGPPGDGSSLTVGLIAAAAGSFMVAGSVLTGMIWMSAGAVLRRRRGTEPDAAPEPITADATPVEATPAPETTSQRRQKPIRQPEPALWPYLLVVLAALAAALLLFMANSGGARRK